MKLHEVTTNTKVIDEHGKPLMVFHGSDKQFDNFDANFTASGASDGILQYGHGIYFTNNEEAAKGYGTNIKRAYLTINNPIHMEQPVPDKVTEYAMNKFPKFKKLSAYEIDRNIGTVHRFLQFMQNARYDTSDVLSELGYDGVIGIHSYANIYVVFNTNQIELIDE